MKAWDTYDVCSFIDRREPDLALRCINWSVDLYVFTDQLDKAILAKWSRVNYLLGVDPIVQDQCYGQVTKGRVQP